MNQLCDFCREQRSMIYCGSDAAYLCLSCDRKVHSANALSKRHLRTLICEGCNSQTAVVRCIEEKLSLCQNCNWSGNYAPDLTIEHKRETINSYSGCPSAFELSRVWSFFYTSCNPEAGTVTLDEEAPLPLIDFSKQDAAMDTIDSDVELFDGFESLNTTNQKAPSMRIKHLGSVLGELEDEDLDLSDIDWNLENCGALFAETLDDPLEFFENAGFDGYFETGNFRDTEYTAEREDVAKKTSTPSTSIQNAENKPADSNTSSSKSDPDIYFPRLGQPSLAIAVAGLTSDCHSESHEDHGLPSMVILVAGHPYNMNCPENLLPSAIRDCAVLRYREKKKSRKYDTKVRYASRKAGAEIRKRVKGRFVKAGEPFDYDPLHLTKACAISKVFLGTHVV